MSIQFLTDAEYKAVRRDMETIVMEDMSFHPDVRERQQVIDKLTAYVDQKMDHANRFGC